MSMIIATPVSRRPDNHAFTIVELLIVIVVIAILAAITIVAYNGIQQRARASEAATALSQAKKKLELYKVDNSNYPTSGNLSAAGITDSDVSYQYTSNGTTYCLTATATNVSYKATDTSSPTAGGCPGHGQGGVAAITNVITNPALINGVIGYNIWSGGNGAVSGSKVSASWTTRGYAYRSTYTTANTTTYSGTIGWDVPNYSTATSSPVALKPNTQYAASWKIRSSIGQRVRPTFTNARIAGGSNGSGSVTINNTSGDVVLSPNVTMDQWLVFTTGANTISGYLCSYVASGSGATYWSVGDYWDIGDMIMVEGNQAPKYADGNSTNWVWNGTANDSTSTGPPL